MAVHTVYHKCSDPIGCVPFSFSAISALVSMSMKLRLCLHHKNAALFHAAISTSLEI